ncbi:MAG: ABC transporter substrate-binding protein [Bacteroides sp.]|nr:ABC transporter substrate-binding protein [Roseburia sp.]MCM1346584.1 ABC transporter substrate-binding protein [Bacteroides sp.]MCM1421402.1 ABC transporter substrate-binding protein [Bacteroides sp.]
MRHLFIKSMTVAGIAASIFSCKGTPDSPSAESTGKISADSIMQQNRDSLFLKADEYSDTITIKYAKGLKVAYSGDTVFVTISNPDGQGGTAPTTLALVKEGKPADNTVIVPVHGVICMTALQLSNFTALGCEDKVVGMTSLRHLFNSKIKRQMKEGKTVRIGKEGAFDVESVIAANPDFIFVSESKRGGFGQLKDCGIPLVPHHGYKETDPLGQAEWIKLAGLLAGEPRRANAVFADIEKKYNALREEVAHKTTNRPTVVSGRQVRDGWYVMGGQSYIARLFADAGADYFMKDNTSTGGQTLDFESVYAQAMNIDFWQIDGSFEGEYTYDVLFSEDSRYGDLKAFKSHNVIFCNFAQVPYREQSPMEPHFLLADFVKAFHPEILPNYTPKYYKLMKK